MLPAGFRSFVARRSLIELLLKRAWKTLETQRLFPRLGALGYDSPILHQLRSCV